MWVDVSRHRLKNPWFYGKHVNKMVTWFQSSYQYRDPSAVVQVL